MLIDPLLKGCDRLIVDSADAGVTRVAEIARKTELPIGDRAFVRSFSWRDLVARFFDDAREALRSIHSIEIVRAVEGKNDPAALLLGVAAGKAYSFYATAAPSCRCDPPCPSGMRCTCSGCQEVKTTTTTSVASKPHSALDLDMYANIASFNCASASSACT